MRIIALLAAAALLAGCTSTPGSAERAIDATVTATSPEPEPSADTDLDDELAPPEPTSSHLIQAALDAGEIDEPTSLLYRLQLLLMAPNFPEEFIGAPEGHDLGLVPEILDKLDSFPPEIRAAIEPYLLRPSDPDSVFSKGLPDPPGIRAGGRAFTTDQDPVRNFCSQWDSRVITGTGFKVWACADYDAVEHAGVSTSDTLDLVGGLIAKHIPRMTADMGPIIPDDPELDPTPGSDDNVDVYLLPASWDRPSRQSYGQSPNYGVTVASAPTAGVTSSAYVMLSSHMLTDTSFLERNLVHELFHVLQYTHNSALGRSWYYDATAEWAASYYVRHDSARLHEVRLPIKQDQPWTHLWEYDGLFRYGAYVWPLFMEQQVGAEAIFATWRELDSAPASAATDWIFAAIDTQLDVQQNFPEFVMRMLNADLPGNPVSPRFSELDSHFPDGRLPRIVARTLDDEPLEIRVTSLYEVSSMYYRVNVPELTDSDKTGIVVRISSTAQSKSGVPLSVEAVAHRLNGDYARHRIEPAGTEICLTEETLLVLANPSTKIGDPATGEITLERVDDAPCSRVEVVDPAYFYQLTDGTRVTINGTENDGVADDAAIAVMVRDADPDLTGDYQVEVTVNGPTLTGPRTFSWPLDTFTDLGNGDWRRTEPLPLDDDLTDANRDLTIDAQLTFDGNDVHRHAPTIKMHAQQDKQCYADVALDGSLEYPLAGMTQPDGSPTMQSYPVAFHERIAQTGANGVFMVTTTSYDGTWFQIFNHNAEPATGVQLIYLRMETFGEVVAPGETGTFTLPATLTVDDFLNTPWPQPRFEDEEGYGMPMDPRTVLHGDVTLTITSHTNSTRDVPYPGEGEMTTVETLHGTMSGTFRSTSAYNAGSSLIMDGAFAFVDGCQWE